MIEVYKITHGLYDDEVKLDLPQSHDSRRGHKYKLFKQRTQTLDIRKHCFTNRVVNTWNNLPAEVVETDSLNSFKNQIDKLWKNEMHNFDP